MRSAFTATLTSVGAREGEKEREREKGKETRRGDVKAIKDLMILDFVMHTRLPEQDELRKRYIERKCAQCFPVIFLPCRRKRIRGIDI